MKQKLTKLKGETNSVILWKFETSHLVINKISRQKIIKGIED